MEPAEENSHSFIVRVWLEETSSATEEVTWQGTITHVPDGRRRAFVSLNEIPEFIASYLADMGVKPALGLRLRRWLGRWKS
jgi:hypothetical protein